MNFSNWFLLTGLDSPGNDLYNQAHEAEPPQPGFNADSALNPAEEQHCTYTQSTECQSSCNENHIPLVPASALALPLIIAQG